MSGEKDLEQLKKEAAAKAKAAALAKMKAKEQGEAKEETPAEDMDLAKQKAAAAAKAKAAALAKMKAKEQGEAKEETKEETPAEDMDLAKQKAAAAAKAKAAAAAKAKVAAQAKQAGGDDEKAKAIAAAKAKAAAAAKAKAAAQAKQAGGDDEKAKAIAAAKAKAAAAAKAKLAAAGKADGAADDDKAKAIAAAKAKAKAAGSKADTEPAAEKAPSVNQPYLDKYVKVIEENLGSDVLEEYYINHLSKEVPTLVARAESYFKLAEFLKYNEQLGFDYLSELHGTDFETHMEVYAHLYSYKKRQSVALKVKIDRDEPVIDSLQPLWAGANWPECETYDLLGIKFKGHPNLYRIMLGEDWIGHPLRKDYEPYDVEV
ncbi:NADH-quinone oxidoreductase subunit C [Cytobacillus firmus]|uniref:NADH-quinone oxidoreductase subunit C n=1 Tax=Cytobacillus firmus TaxID=1399 RepID=UPI0018CF8F02|nr:NADH-quinone oxidoreductase subunit C [Cytobacillus firmus]MBG9654605.1 NADH-quinone oxidoreductase subunit C [Cytobacillus firmus]MED1905569.1 NADH-quinone oxidoreductase subunit C [Cytobacillus firmus]